VGVKHSTTVQRGPGARPFFCTMGSGSFPAVKWQGLGFNHPQKSNAEVKEKIDLYLYSRSGTSWTLVGVKCFSAFTFIGPV